MVGASLKSQLKQHRFLMGTDADPEILKDFLPGIVAPNLMEKLFQGSGY